mgnify:CR=1 FL=1
MTVQSDQMTLARILRTWWPLAVSWLLMGLEGPLVSLVVARLADPEMVTTPNLHANWASRGYDITADGQRIVLVRTPERSRPREVRGVFNWFAELKRLAGDGGAR